MPVKDYGEKQDAGKTILINYSSLKTMVPKKLIESELQDCSCLLSTTYAAGERSIEEGRREADRDGRERWHMTPTHPSNQLVEGHRTLHHQRTERKAVQTPVTEARPNSRKASLILTVV